MSYFLAQVHGKIRQDLVSNLIFRKKMIFEVFGLKIQP